MRIVAYEDKYRRVWNETVALSRNGTFLLNRSFMDYHRQRFQDASLLALDDKGHCLGVLPANTGEDGTVESHGGLTYGGVVVTDKVNTLLLKEMLGGMARFYREGGNKSLLYKPIPYIYHSYPTGEDLYWLFRADARLVARGISATIDLESPIPLSQLRKRKIKKAESQQLTVSDSITFLAPFWKLLGDVLEKYHATSPVHTFEEISLLARAFSDNIRLYTVHPPGKEPSVLAGCLLFLSKNVAHVQYIASGEVGRGNGALDYLFFKLTGRDFLQQKYLDFGISTEQGGRYLNEGLVFQKEGFGGRGVCYDAYWVDLEKMARL